jgi:hypothetical protein
MLRLWTSFRRCEVEAVVSLGTRVNPTPAESGFDGGIKRIFQYFVARTGDYFVVYG